MFLKIESRSLDRAIKNGTTKNIRLN